MGCGKTTAGKRLALKLGYEFVDLDHVIEAVEQRTIAEIFEQEGQNAFRLIEQRELHNTFNLKNTIVSTGGGAPCFFDNIEQMNKHGKTVYIQLTPKTLVDRLKSAKDERPLIKGKTNEELFAFIQNALVDREPFYTKAHYIINGIDISAEIIINTLKIKQSES
jgi:shikimate kinase